ncbi:root hair defective 3 GTP-binding protein [Metschnikowia bicuspidata var. bicuspidata NRRL YB-4993]|uniref:Root hair defective 3 GTP-binding protein n=1 Tax=Metschnikowia bicuspidata var. bicuspidata NRRL YB-4993 TaxID=869754 RepID=A0A1A0H9G9_9ASCO|nr:root hair defective 3 GTP-binding protein [Metschnikowia bicuspidata var. bicuspidata NRRL YB-4993]OBA20769.1 root hair defective 3 GTP-binding protein [Metschnikowia bicuspidata var. bicuspidata NRRL YB-4993]
MPETPAAAAGRDHVTPAEPHVPVGGPPRAASPASAASSFVPIDSVQDAIQLIDEHKNFNSDILDYISQAASPGAGRAAADHRIISVFGSQSTGKSTLLNALFNTNFGVMDEVNRQQTTKGIWLAVSPGVNNSVEDAGHVARDSIIVMDVEGTDGRERGEDQDFERKAALFAMATSEVLIVNLWETQVGLYQGANMGLLKTVFEVNLSLFGTAKLHRASSSSEHKVLLLFVIRDHLGVTPKESLAATITQDLLKIWENLNKPSDVAHLAFADFFDLDFHTLGHKVLQHDKFMLDVRLLGNRFIDSADDAFLFKPFYHHDIPIEGWTMYAENCWDQIDSNKDLDLPTQQILVAKFKCDEIVAACYSDFLVGFDVAKADATRSLEPAAPDYQKTGLDLAALKDITLAAFDLQASKYNTSVYEQRRAILDEKVNAKLSEILSVYSKQLLSSSLKTFAVALAKKPRTGTFVDHVSASTDALRTLFAKNLASLSLNGQLTTNDYADSLEVELAKLIAKQQLVELNTIVSKHLKKLTSGLKIAISQEISSPSQSTWDQVMEKFDMAAALFLEKYTSDSGMVDFGVGAEDDMNKLTLRVFEFQSWQTLHTVIHKHISKDNLLTILKDRFDDKFRYDQNGLPRLYQNGKELDAAFGEAKGHAMKVFPILTIARLSNGAEIMPKYDVFDKTLKQKYDRVKPIEDGLTLDERAHEDSDSDDDENNEKNSFAEILSESEKSEVALKFKREIDAKFVETKRSIIQHVTQIPYYIYLLIVALGWNEFMAVIRNPFFFTLLLVLGAAVYVMYQTNLLGPALLVAQRMVDEAVLVGKQKLREFVVEDQETHAKNLRKMGESPESVELKDLEPQLGEEE